ncbi:MAG: hypothetical protein JXR63_13190 [Spirochaetales bacterium]|nr:hypothetical protein [Spirochaetales bacterium]
MGLKKETYKNIGGLSFAILALIFAFWLWIVARGFQFNSGHNGMIEYKAFYSYETLRGIVGSYGEEGTKYYILLLIFDFLFIFGYTLSFYGIINYLFFENKLTQRFALLSILLITASIDILEKIFIISVLIAHPNEYFLGYILLQSATIIKFTLVGILILISLIKGIKLLFK